MRWLIRCIVLASVLLGGAWLALQAYLRGGSASGRVAERLTALLGVPVRVGGVEVGAGASAATDVSVFESADASEPFVTIARAGTDLGLTDLLAGSDPKRLTLSGAQVVLRHDAQGHLVTRLPQPRKSDRPAPAVRLDNAQLTIRKQGDPDRVIRGITGDLVSEGGRMRLTCTVHDPEWGDATWQASGTAADGSGELTLQVANIHVTPAMLRRVPYVKSSIWEHVVAEGDTPVKARIAFAGAGQPVTYRVELTPENTAVSVSSIDLEATQTRGRVIVEDKQVLLKDVRGRVAAGELLVRAADLDFRGDVDVMRFDLRASRLDLHALPKSWRLPPRLGGRLSGDADLTVRVVGGRPIPSGAGEGRVDGASIGPVPFPSYGLRIQADRSGFVFAPFIAGRPLIPGRPGGGR
jgi:hypothetical protein